MILMHLKIYKTIFKILLSNIQNKINDKFINFGCTIVNKIEKNVKLLTVSYVCNHVCRKIDIPNGCESCEKCLISKDTDTIIRISTLIYNVQ